MTDIEKVRLLIGDSTIPYTYTDAQIQAFLDMADDNIFMAAAYALKSWAASIASVADSERIGDYAYSNKAVANKLAVAENYIKMAITTPAMDWASLDLLGTET
jgi:uncharacterized Fe-S radical SAM superfamily protein PflX